MRRAILGMLVDPWTLEPLGLDVTRQEGEEVISGRLRGGDGRTHPIVDGIPRFSSVIDAAQQQTADSFGFKWHRRDTFTSEAVMSTTRGWFLKRYGFATLDEARAYFAGRARILDAGCGAGLGSSLWLTPGWRGDGHAEWIGADISSAVEVAHDRLSACPGTSFLQADLTRLPFRPGTFDAIFSEGVLHHTPSTEASLKTVARLLAPGGELLFYVYRKKGPIREFSDDLVRGLVSNKEPAEAWDALRSLTRLGQALAELRVEVDVPEDVPYLGIKAGKIDVQRLVYWSFLKAFWDPARTLEENVHINFDWYHPRYAHRQSEEEVRRWCAEADLTVTRLDVEESGFTVRAVAS